MNDTEPSTVEKTGWRIEQAVVPAVILLVPIGLFFGREVIPPIRFLTWHLASLAWFVVVLAAAWGQGRALAGLVLPDTGDRAQVPVTVIALGLGLGLFALETFLLGAARLLTTPALTMLVLLVFLLTAAGARRRWPELRAEYQAARQLPAGSGLPLALTGLAVFVSWPFVLVPTRAFDALSYHLEVPSRYLQAGRIIDIPENLYSYTPQLNHMLYGLAMGLSGSDLAGLLNHLYFVLTLCVLWLGFRDRFAPPAGAWAAALTALSPLMLMEVVNAGVDWSAAFYTLAALSLLSSGIGNRRLVVLAGILAGLAAGCRHQPLGYAIAVPVAAGMISGLTAGRGGRFGRWGLFLGVALLTASPWYIRNWVYTGDPLFPLLANLLGTTDAGAGFVSGLVGAKPLALLWKWAVLPYQMVFDPLSYSMTATIGVQYLVLLPLLALARGRPRGDRFLLWWVILAFLAWYLNFRTARYAMPVLMTASLWLGAALADSCESLSDGSRSGRSRALAAVVTVLLVVNGAVFVGLNDRVNRSVGAALGMRSSSGYLMENYEIYPAIDYLNRLDPPPDKVLFVGEMRGFYSRFPREVPSHNAPNRLMELARKNSPPAEISKDLAAAGISHILLNEAEWFRMAYRNGNAPDWKLSPEGRERVKRFLEDDTRQLFSNGPVTVYGLKNRGAGEAAP
ncbi:MAG: hypothetical protein P1S46_01740 [bacterium]|nr:hypothetical protein [bacterium]